MFTSVTGKNALETILLLVALCCGAGYNLDTQFPIIYSGSKDSYFGYTTALHVNQRGPMVLIGAPRSNTSTLSEPVRQPGALFGCKVTGNQPSCEEIFLMTEGAVEKSKEYYVDGQMKMSYEDGKYGMWLGVSLDVRPGPLAENDIVTCGHLWKNEVHHAYGVHYVNGVCYIINGDLEASSVRKLLPLTLARKQNGKFKGSNNNVMDFYYYAHGQVGISAAFSEDGSNLILGAPGIYSWRGSIVDYPVASGSGYYRNPQIPDPAYEINYNVYFGYSVTSGRFYKSKIEYYAVGAPKDGSNKGKVYIVSVSEGQMLVHGNRTGSQLGEYFGASVLGVDLNRDSYADLLVGAPLNSLESGGDEGKVYVFISTGNDLRKGIELTGDKKSNARFGTALANVGDINQDGFTDIAIGAPYEDGTGAVFIYHGSRTGVKSGYVQKITAASINSNLAGFGIHISRGLDIDDNEYPDILVGAYSSSNAVLFRSRPVMRAFPEIVFTPKQIKVNQTMCALSEKNLTCFQVEACLRYNGKHVPSSLDFQFLVEIKDSRAFFNLNTGRASTSRQRVVLDMNQKICSLLVVYLSSNIKDVLTPIPINFAHSLTSPSGPKKFDETFPVYHPSSPTNITSEISFQTGCGLENECTSDLIVSASRTEPAEGGLMTLGKFARVSVTITVVNRGEPAYLSELLIYLPPEMPIINEDICESASQHSNASLVCRLGNPLQNGSQVEIHIKLDATKIPPHTKYLEISCQAVTLSREINPEDNAETVPLHLETLADIGITGIPLQDKILYDETHSGSPTVTHTYIVRNHGPSQLETIDIQLSVPYAFLTHAEPEPFVSFTGLQVDNGMEMTVPAVCEDASLKIRKIQISERKPMNDGAFFAGSRENNSLSFDPPGDLTKRSDVRATTLEVDTDKTGNVTEPSSLRGHFVINCKSKNVECITLRCSASPFTDLRKFAQLSFDLQMNFTVVSDHLGQWYQIEFITDGFVSVRQNEVIPLHHHPESSKVKTVILHEGPPPPGEIAPWIVFVSVGVGVILLLIILIILIKIGFFKRKEKDKMKKILDNAGNEEKQYDQEVNDTAVLE